MGEEQDVHVKELTSGRLLARNTLLNLVGQLVPMVVGLVTIPLLIRNLGTDRFAVITIAWMVIGYFSLFDMGLGRALTQLVAERIGQNRPEDIPGIFWTSMSLMLVLSVCGALTVTLLASPLARTVLKVPGSLQAETISALYIMAASIPFVIMTTAIVGVLTAYQRFDIINTIRIPLGAYTFAAPLLILPFSSSMAAIIGTLLMGRGAAFLVHLRYCLRVVPALRTSLVVDRNFIKPLLRFGGWMTVSNIVGPLLVYFDRFLIGAIISLSAVAYYTTPYEFVTKLWIIPGALMTVLFPAFATSRDTVRTAELFHRAVKYQLLAIFPLAFIIVAGAHQGLSLWLGRDFADNSYRVLQWLAIGVFINCLAQVPFSYLQGIGKPDVTSKLHVAELAIYIPTLWLLTNSFGITGAAIAWTTRVAIDSLLLFYMTHRTLRPISTVSRTTVLCLVAAVASLACVMLLPAEGVNLVVFTAFLIFLMTAGWKTLLSGHERSYLLCKLSAGKAGK